MDSTADKRWNLDVLYTHFKEDHFLRDMQHLSDDISVLQKQADALENAESLERFLMQYEKTLRLLYNLYTFSELNFAADTGNEEATRAISRLDELSMPLASIESLLIAFLNRSDALDDWISESEYLHQHAYTLTYFKKRGSHILPQSQEKILSTMEITGSKAWSALQSKLTSGLMATVHLPDGEKELPISSVRNLATDPSPEVRKAAYEAELAAYGKVAESVAMSMNSIKGEVTAVSKLRKYASPLERTLFDSRMTQKTLDAMFDAIKRSLPHFHKYLRQKSKVLGHENGLPFYDLFAPMGGPSKEYTYEEAASFVETYFSDFSPALANTARTAVEHNWIDVSPRPGKVSGAFCAPLHDKGEFRILHNFTGSLADVITLAHELGHGYHDICLKDESILNANVPLPLAETASTFCETLVTQAALKLATHAEALTLLETSLQDATQVICDIYSRYLFETAVFEKQPLSVSAMNALMLESQKEAYGAGLDPDQLHPYMWLIKPHYYDANYNFYNFPYAFGLLFAKGLYARYLESPETFVPKYDALLKATGKSDILTVCELMDIDAESSDFWDNSLKILQKDIEQFIQWTEEAL